MDAGARSGAGSGVGHAGDVPGAPPSTARLLACGAVHLLVVLSIVPWRDDAIFDGGLDPVVAAKAVLSLTALLAALVVHALSWNRYPIGLGPASAVCVVLLVSALGSLIAGNAAATAVLVIRILLLVAVVLLQLSTFSWSTNLAALLGAMVAVAAGAALTGLPGLVEEGRLGGGIPQMHPNQLAGLAGPPLVATVVVILRRGVQMWSSVVAAVLLAIVVATGSRTALLAIAVAVLVAVLANGIRNRSVVYLLLGVAPVAYAVLLFTDVLDSLATRAGSTDTVSSLDSRLDAWKVVLSWGWGDWQKWIGLGLSVKQVPVDIKWRDEQVLDSSWVSVLAQAGLLGTAVLALLVGWCVLAATVSSRRRQILLPLLVLVLLRSVTESGLIDSAVPFLLLLVLATMLTGRSRREARAEGGAADGCA